MKISFVIPCYRSENTIGIVVDEIDETMKQRPGYEYEIVLVNDGSPDNVWSVISNLSETKEYVTGINLAKNFGQHCALMAGYNNVSGDYVVSLDDDGQTPACEVFKLLDEFENGYDVVYASYPENHQNAFRRWGSDFAKKMSDYMFDIKGDDNKGSSFFACKRFVIDEITTYKHSYPYIAGLLMRVTRNMGFVNVNHRDRLEGKSGYSFKALVSLWLNGFTAFSVKPLELGAYIGFITAALGFVFAIYTIIRRIVNPNMTAGWSSLIAVLLILGGIIMVMLGLIGEYIGRIYICINNSPQYVIKDIAGRKADK
ncbi:MAG: glycosyltransferase family 2 protein [Lachnospiraceae bacterium]|nr:glycosyltransferase family 2 protein [Lachnospiraceae bacterium]